MLQLESEKGRVLKPWIGHFVSRHKNYDTQVVEVDTIPCIGGRGMGLAYSKIPKKNIHLSEKRNKKRNLKSWT